MDDLLQVAVSQFRVRVADGDRLSLLGEAKAAIDTAGWLSANCPVGRSSPARYCSAAAVKDRQCNAMLLGDLGNLFLRLVKRPVGSHVATIFVTVGVADHHHL